MNDIKEKEQLPIVPLATYLLSCEYGQTDGQTDDGEVIPICRHYSVEATQKSKEQKDLIHDISKYQ
jgi:hypothetical protein